MKKTNNLLDLVFRYSILVISAFFIPIFYFIFAPLTIYPLYFLFKIFFNPVLEGDVITILNLSIEIIKACVAGSAYYLLFALNLATPKIRLKKRIKMILLSFAILLIVNILRIFLLSIFLIYSSPLFDLTHLFFWYVLSTLFVVAIWFGEVKYFKIKEIPFYSDIKFLLKKSFLK